MTTTTDFRRQLSRTGAGIAPNGSHYKIVLLGDDSYGIERVTNGIRKTIVGPKTRRFSMVAAEHWAVTDGTPIPYGLPWIDNGMPW